MLPYIENFRDENQVLKEFCVEEDVLDNAEILLAWYGLGDYEGEALVIFKREGTLFEVNGSHCSCFGLEGQWEPEETSWGALAMRKFDRSLSGWNEANTLLQELITRHLLRGEQ